jgi:hypothetical protein
VVDHWDTHAIYEDYYAACACRQCTHSLGSRFDEVMVFTSIMSISAGLPAVLNFVVVLAVKVGQYVARYRRRYVQPVNTISA